MRNGQGTEFRTRDAGASEPLVHRSFIVECDSDKAFDPETRTWRVVASTDAIDSYEEIVDQSWDLKRFKANPIILWNHQRREAPIGTAKVKVEALPHDTKRKGLMADIKFAEEGTSDRIDEIVSLVGQKILRMVSVGFRPGKVKAEEGADGKTIYRLMKNTLYEISVTPIGANPEALGTKDGDPAYKDSSEYLAMRSKALEEFNAGKPAPPTEERGDQQENTPMAMTDEEKAALASAEARAKTAETARDEAVTAQRTAEKESAKSLEEVTVARDKAQGELDAAKNETTALEVKGFVGTKILPAELESLTKLAQTNRTMFDELMAARTEMPATKPGSVLGTDPTGQLDGDESAIKDLNLRAAS